MSATFIKESF